MQTTRHIHTQINMLLGFRLYVGKVIDMLEMSCWFVYFLFPRDAQAFSLQLGNEFRIQDM